MLLARRLNPVVSRVSCSSRGALPTSTKGGSLGVHSSLTMPYRRTLTDSTKSSAVANTKCAVAHRPPMLIRAAIVGSSVGVCTPIFATAGIATMWYRYLPKSLEGIVIKYIVGIVIGGGGGVLIWNHVVPFLTHHSEMVLPFAVANGMAASFWYCVAEMTVGLDKMMMLNTVEDAMVAATSASNTVKGTVSAATATASAAATDGAAGVVKQMTSASVWSKLPFAGCALGVATSITTAYLWEPCMQICWGEDLRNLIIGDMDKAGSNWMKDLYTDMMFVVGMPIGAMAGSTMHYILKPFVMGTPGIAYKSRSLPALGAILLTAGTYFLVFRTSEDEWWWETRIDTKSGNIVSKNILSKEIVTDQGKKGKEADLKRDVIKGFHVLRVYRQWFADLFSDVYVASSSAKHDDGNDNDNAIDIADKKMQQQYVHFPFAPRPLKNLKMTLRTSKERSHLFFLIDRLLRLKHLDMLLIQSQNEVDRLLNAGIWDPEATSDQKRTTAKLIGQRRMLLEHSRNVDGIDDLAAVLKASEMGVWAFRQRDSSNSYNKQILDDVKQVFVKNTKSIDRTLPMILLGTGNDEAKHKIDVNVAYSLALLQNNFDVLQDEFLSNLQYEVSLHVNDIDVQSFQQTASWQRFFAPVKTVTFLAATASVVALLLSR